MAILLNGKRYALKAAPEELDMIVEDTSCFESYGVRLVNYKVAGPPRRKNGYVSITGRDGVLPQDSPYQTGEVEIEFAMVADTVELVMDMYRTFTTWLHTLGSSFKLTFSDDATVYRLVQPNGFDDIDPVQGLDCAVIYTKADFLMVSPFIHSLTQTKLEFDIESGEAHTINVPGMYVPLHMDVEFASTTAALYLATGLGSSSDTEDVQVTGIKIVVNDEDGDTDYDGYIEYNGALGEKDVLTIDTDDDYDVLLNGVSDIANFNGILMALKSGQNTIYMENTEAMPLHIIITFNRRWI